MVVLYSEFFLTAFVHKVSATFNAIEFHCTDKKCLPFQYFFVLHKKKKVIQVWNDLRVNKL